VSDHLSGLASSNTVDDCRPDLVSREIGARRVVAYSGQHLMQGLCLQSGGKQQSNPARIGKPDCSRQHVPSAFIIGLDSLRLQAPLKVRRFVPRVVLDQIKPRRVHTQMVTGALLPGGR
jgi:hypothetical protein